MALKLQLQPSEQLSLFGDGLGAEGSESSVAVAGAPVASRARAKRVAAPRGPRRAPASKAAEDSFAWSHAAHKCFRRCQLQYAFAHLAASHAARDPLRREAHRLKQLKDLPLWRGTLVDEAIAKWVVPGLSQGNLAPLDEVTAQAHALARRQLDFSRRRAYLEPGMTKAGAGGTYCALEVHEGGDLSERKFEQVLEEVAVALRNLYAQRDFLQMLSGQHAHHPKQRFHFKMDGIGVGGEIDLLCWGGASSGARTAIIVDWKAVTSAASDHTDQMLLYALAVSRMNRGVRAESIRAFEARLYDGSGGEVREHAVTEEGLAEAESRVYLSAREMAALMGGRSYSEQMWEGLEPASNPNTCAMCRFRQPCEELQRARSESD